MLALLKTFFVILAGFIAFNNGARAITECNTIQDCLSLRNQDSVLTWGTEGPVELGDVVEHPYINGQIWFMSHQFAFLHCQSIGERLPTPRELAMTLNPKGLSDTNPGDGVSRHIVSRVKDTYNYDSFYYNQKTYKRPEGTLGNINIWSSSHSADYGYEIGTAFKFTFNGYLHAYTTYDTLAAVRCVRSR